MKINIIDKQVSSFHICYDSEASECIRYAAKQLQKYLYASTYCLIPVFSSKCERRGKEIHLGLKVRDNDYSYYTSNLSKEGFVITNHFNDIIKENDLVFTSKSDRGILYAVYYFLEKEIGLNCLDSKMTIFNHKDSIDFTNPIKHDFLFEYRECYFTDAFEGNYASMNMLNSNLADLSSRLGGKTKWYNFHHSFSDLINPKKYFDHHPEYFSEIDGVRIKEHTELCLSNHDVFRLCLNKIKKWIKNNPDCKVISVAQDEWMGHFTRMACECEKCREVDKKYESQSASIIIFVNKIASALEEEYPDILIHTFAYQYSRKPPVGLKVHKNVIVRLTNIECSWNESIEEGAKRDPNSRNAAFLKDLIGWSHLTKRLYIWDYAVNYRNYLLPFPCLRTMAKNIELYKRIGVKGLLMEGNFSFGGKGYLDELKSFITSKLMQKELLNEIELENYFNHLVNYFCDNYYGKASPYIKEYIYLFENSCKDIPIWLYDDSDSLIFNDEIVKKARILLNKAIEESKEENELIKEHINICNLGLVYLELTRLPLDCKNRNELIDDFNNNIRKVGITELFERTNLDYSIEVMKKSQYAKCRENWYSLYYIMK